MSTRKRITELTVAELRIQLGKRGVDTTGERPLLISKLKKALQEENAKGSPAVKAPQNSAASGDVAQQAQSGGGSVFPGPTKLKTEKIDEESSSAAAGTDAPATSLAKDEEKSSSDTSSVTPASDSASASSVKGAAGTVGVAAGAVTPVESAHTASVADTTTSPSLVASAVGMVGVPTSMSPTVASVADTVSFSSPSAADATDKQNLATGEDANTTKTVSANDIASASHLVTSSKLSEDTSSGSSSISTPTTVTTANLVREDRTTTSRPAITVASAKLSEAVAEKMATPSLEPVGSSGDVQNVDVTAKPIASVNLQGTTVARKAPVASHPASVGTPKTPASNSTKVAAVSAVSRSSPGIITTKDMPAAAVAVAAAAAASSSPTPAVVKVEPTDKTTTAKPVAESMVTVVAPASQQTSMDEGKKDDTVESLMDVSSLSTTADQKIEVSTATPSSAKPLLTNKIGTETTPAGDNAEHSLWVSGLASSFRAADLRMLFGKYGKVVAAKVVTSAKSPGSKCFGFVLMNSSAEAELAINNLNNTEVQGQKITVEKDSQKRAILQPSSSPAVPASTTLWVNGLSNNTKAADLKILFMKYGKVTGAKVVTSARNPGSKCYGLVTLSTVEEVDLCIQHLNKTEFHGKIISLEKAKTDVKTQSKTSVSAPASSSSVTNIPKAAEVKCIQASPARSLDSKSSDMKKDEVKQKPKETDKPKEVEKAKDEHPRDAKKDDSMLSLDKIREERERERRMQRERAAREDERRRLRQMENERRMQRAEAERLARERERLRVEKMRLERERLEAERARIELERERREREREREREIERIERMERQRRESHQATTTYRTDLKRASTSNEGSYWPQSKRPLLDENPSSSSFGGYDAHSSSSFYDKSSQVQYGASDRRDSARAREPEKTGSAIPSVWSNYRSHDTAYSRSTEPAQRSAPVEQSSFNTSSDWNRGVSANQWQTPSNAYRGVSGGTSDASYSVPGPSVDPSRQYAGSTPAGSHQSRQYVSSTPTSNAYMGTPSSSQPYSKWY